MSKVRVFILLHFIGVSMLFAQDHAGDISVETTGSGTSAKAALADAKRNAVEQGIGSILISQTEIENFELKKDLILTETVGAVKTYEILAETRLPDDIFQVKIKAVVSAASIREDLLAMKILLESMDKPRLMVIIDEPNQQTIETAIISYLVDKGFDLVDKSVVANAMDKEKMTHKEAALGADAAIARLGMTGGAEYVVAGRATKSSSPGSFGMKSGQVTLSTRIINCSTARILASKSESASFAHVSEDIAFEKAAVRAAEKVFDDSLFEKLLASFQNSVNNGVTLDVKVTNVPNYKTQKSIAAKIKSMTGTVSASKRGFSLKTLSLSVVYKGSADSFCDSIDGFDTGKGILAVVDVTGNRITIEIDQ